MPRTAGTVITSYSIHYTKLYDDRAVGAEVLLAPHLGEDRLPRDGAPLVLDQEHEQIVLPRGEIHRLIGAEHQPPVQVDGDIGELDLLRA